MFNTILEWLSGRFLDFLAVHAAPVLVVVSPNRQTTIHLQASTTRFLTENAYNTYNIFTPYPVGGREVGRILN